MEGDRSVVCLQVVAGPRNNRKCIVRGPAPWSAARLAARPDDSIVAPAAGGSGDRVETRSLCQICDRLGLIPDHSRIFRRMRPLGAGLATASTYAYLRRPRPRGQVPAPLGQRKHGSKGGATACRSLMEGSPGRAVGNLAQERLVIRVPTAKGMKPDGLSAEVHFAPDQAVRPEGIGLDGAPEQAHPAGLRGATDEDHHSARLRVQIREPESLERTSRGSRLDAGGSALPVRARLAPRTFLD